MSVRLQRVSSGGRAAGGMALPLQTALPLLYRRPCSGEHWRKPPGAGGKAHLAPGAWLPKPLAPPLAPAMPTPLCQPPMGLELMAPVAPAQSGAAAPALGSLPCLRRRGGEGGMGSICPLRAAWVACLFAPFSRHRERFDVVARRNRAAVLGRGETGQPREDPGHRFGVPADEGLFVVKPSVFLVLNRYPPAAVLPGKRAGITCRHHPVARADARPVPGRTLLFAAGPLADEQRHRWRAPRTHDQLVCVLDGNRGLFKGRVLWLEDHRPGQVGEVFVDFPDRGALEAVVQFEAVGGGVAGDFRFLMEGAQQADRTLKDHPRPGWRPFDVTDDVLGIDRRAAKGGADDHPVQFGGVGWRKLNGPLGAEGSAGVADQGDPRTGALEAGQLCRKRGAEAVDRV